MNILENFSHSNVSEEYSIPGILQFLRNESMKNEILRAQWNVEKAELQARIAFLQGERKGEENLKKDLVRRIKMLEFALKMETKRLNEIVKQKLNGDINLEPDINNDQAVNVYQKGYDLKEIKIMLENSGFKEMMDEIRENRINHLMGIAEKDKTNESHNDNYSIDKPQSSYKDVCDFNDKMGQLNNNAESPIYDTVDDSGSCNIYGGIHENSVIENSNLVQISSSHSNIIDAGVSASLGELAGLTIANEAATLLDESLSGSSENCGSVHIDNRNQSSNSTKPFIVPWSAKYTLRNHYDSVRCLSFHSTKLLLASGSEDCTVKLWSLTNTTSNTSNKKSSLTNTDLEPIHTFRGHSAPVLNVLIQDDVIYSSDLNGVVKIWCIDSQMELYDEYKQETKQEITLKHSSAVWALTYQNSSKRLLTGTSDGFVEFWSENKSTDDKIDFKKLTDIQLPFSQTGAVSTIEIIRDSNIVSDYSEQIVVGTSNGDVVLINIETGQIIRQFINNEDERSSVYKLVQHPNQSLIIGGHEDRCIRIFDINSGQLISRVTAHLDAVTSVGFEARSQQNHLISTSHDCSIRIWDLSNQSCVQETTTHRKKWDESIHALSVHPTQPYFATAGADAIIKVFV